MCDYLQSGGELENDERIANVIAGLITLTDRIDPKAYHPNETFDKITITYHDHCYIICLSNKKIHVIKKRLSQPMVTSDIQSLERQTTIGT